MSLFTITSNNNPPNSYNEIRIGEKGNSIKSPLTPIILRRNVIEDNPNNKSLEQRIRPLNDLLNQLTQNKNKKEDAERKIIQRRNDPHCDKKHIAFAAICTLVSTAILVGSIALAALFVSAFSFVSIPVWGALALGLAITVETSLILSLPLTLFSLSVYYLHDSIKESKRNPEQEINNLKNEKAYIKNSIKELDKDSINAINEIIEICDAKIELANIKNFDSRRAVDQQLHNDAIRLKNNLENIKSRFGEVC